MTNNEDKAKNGLKSGTIKLEKIKKKFKVKLVKQQHLCFEPDERQIYIYNSTWGRGLDIVHDAFGMPMTKQYKDKLQEDKKAMLPFQKKILVNMLVIIYFK